MTIHPAGPARYIGTTMNDPWLLNRCAAINAG